MKYIISALVVMISLWTALPARAQFSFDIDIDEAPFNYTQTPDENRVSRFLEKIAKREVILEFTSHRGYLESLLAALEIPQSSQTLVFSKTSMQVRYISPRNPRAIYFNDDTYVGWVNGSSLVEISTVDAKLGAAFYTLDMVPRQPHIQRANYDCLACHATSLTQGIPGHTVRSVIPGYDGRINSQDPSFITNDRSPFSERWGGWYVTGLHGDIKHLGNVYSRGGSLDTSHNGNRVSVRGEFDSFNYLSPYSDIVALMVLEHQTQMHNALTRANYFTRKLAYDADRRAGTDVETPAQLALIAAEVVERLLFCGETKLTDEVRGSNEFSADFQSRGQRDQQGRSLRDFDLKSRMFKYPCSYVIYSPAFMSLAPCLRKEIVRQLTAVLSAQTSSPKFAHLSAEDRGDVLAILGATHPDFD